TVNMEIMQLKVLSELSVDKKVKTEKGIPYLRKIPYIGRLFFATTEDSYENTKLYIVGGIVPSGGQDLKEFYAFKNKVENLAKERSEYK
ncbi:MAG TPA: hypothetical protein VMZ91_08770, partial [Candidatus Paceibacterota bacterium]|nr:hypothetical protein [Candidatus Paceibacterota bacterium]